MTDNMYLIWSQLLIVFFGALFYLSKTEYSVIKTQTVNMENKNEIKKFTALFNFEQYFKTFLTVFSYTLIILIFFTLSIQFVIDSKTYNVNFNVIAYVHIILSIFIAVYITSRGTLKVTENGISITSILFKKTFFFKDINFIRRIYIENEIGVIELVLKNKNVYRINLNSYRETKELKQFMEYLFEGVKEKIS